MSFRQVAVEGYTEWIQLVADLTIHSLTFWQWASSSVYYLLGECRTTYAHIYDVSISLVADLTIHSLTFWQWASSSVYTTC